MEKQKSKKKPKILIIDDEPKIREIIAELVADQFDATLAPIAINVSMLLVPRTRARQALR